MSPIKKFMFSRKFAYFKVCFDHCSAKKCYIKYKGSLMIGEHMQKDIMIGIEICTL